MGFDRYLWFIVIALLSFDTDTDILRSTLVKASTRPPIFISGHAGLAEVENEVFYISFRCLFW